MAKSKTESKSQKVAAAAIKKANAAAAKQKNDNALREQSAKTGGTMTSKGKPLSSTKFVERVKAAIAAPAKPAPGKPGPAAAPGVPGAPAGAQEPNYGVYTDTVNGMAAGKYTAPRREVTNAIAGIDAKLPQIDQVAKGFHESLAAAKIAADAHVAASQAAIQSTVGAATAASTGEGARVAAGQLNDANARGTISLAPQAQAMGDQGAVEAGARQGAAASLTLQGLADANTQARTQLGTIVGADTGRQKTLLGVERTKQTDRLGDLAKQEGGDKAIWANELQQKDLDRFAAQEIAAGNDQVKLASIAADKAKYLAANKLTDKRLGITQDANSETARHNAAQEKLATGKALSDADFKTLTAKEKHDARVLADGRAERTTTAAEKRAETADWKAHHPSSAVGKDERVMSTPKGKTVKLSAADAKKWDASHNTFNAMTRAVSSHAGSQDVEKIHDNLMKHYKVDDAVAQAAIDFALHHKNIGLAGYQALTKFFPGGVVPGGLWVHGDSRLKQYVRG